MSQTINITDLLDYACLDTAIGRLTALRELHGGKSIIDVSLERTPYDTSDHIEINLIPKGK